MNESKPTLTVSRYCVAIVTLGCVPLWASPEAVSATYVTGRKEVGVCAIPALFDGTVARATEKYQGICFISIYTTQRHNLSQFIASFSRSTHQNNGGKGTSQFLSGLISEFLMRSTYPSPEIVPRSSHVSLPAR
jgi:hypothetical protein